MRKIWSWLKQNKKKAIAFVVLVGVVVTFTQERLPIEDLQFMLTDHLFSKYGLLTLFGGIHLLGLGGGDGENS